MAIDKLIMLLSFGIIWGFCYSKQFICVLEDSEKVVL